MTQNPRIAASRELATAMEDGDANAAAQILLGFPATHPEGLDRAHIKHLAEISFYATVRTGFWHDVTTLLNLETQSDEETEEAMAERCQQEGRAAWAAKTPYDGNPYAQGNHEDEFHNWAYGWIRADDEDYAQRRAAKDAELDRWAE